MHRSRTFKLAVFLFLIGFATSFLAAPGAWADDRADDVVADNGEPTDPERAMRDVHRSRDRDEFPDVSFRSLLLFLEELGIINPWGVRS